MNRSILILVLAIAFVIPGCKKYDDGPLVSLVSKGNRVNGTWYFQSVLYGNIDSTSRYTYQRIDFYYSRKYEGGAFTWDHDLIAQTLNENIYETGTWKFIADKDSFEMVTYKNHLKDSVSTKWKINRLAYKEFWLERHIRDTLKLQLLLIKYDF